MRNNKGFSITEVLVAVAMMGGVSLGVMKLMEIMQKGQKSSEIKMEVLELRRRIVTAMADKLACEKTFGSKKIGEDIDFIKNRNGTIIVEKNQEVANKRLKVTRIHTEHKEDLGNDMHEVKLIVDFENLMKNHSYGANKKFETLLKVEATGTNATITRCFDDRENTVITAIDEAGGEICRILGGEWDITQPLNKRCMYAECGEGEFLSGEEDVEYTRELEDGTRVTTTQKAFKCKPLKICDVNEYQTGFDANGEVQCKTYTTECEEGNYLVGYDSNGNKICKPDYRNVGKCPTGSYLEGFNTDGSKSCASFEERIVVSSVFSLNVNDESGPSNKNLDLGKHLFCASAGWGGPGSNDSSCTVSVNSDGKWRLDAQDVDNDDDIGGSTTCRAICFDLN